MDAQVSQPPRVSYRTLLIPRARRRLVVTGALSRLPLAGAGVAIVLAAGGATHSYGLAGTASALYVIAASVMAPLHARRMDRMGQRRVLLVAGTAQAAAFASLMLVCRTPGWWQVPGIITAAAVAGAAQVDIGSAVRARWAHAMPDRVSQQTAFLLESVVDELMFILAPMAITAVTSAQSWAAPAVVLLGPAVGWLLLAGQTGTAPPPLGKGGAHPAGRRPTTMAGSRALVAAFVGIGAYLGSIEILLVALADAAGEPYWAGYALAAWALGSAAAALLAGPHLGRLAPERVFVPAMAWMTGCGLLLPLAGPKLPLVIACFLAGIGAAPSLSSGFSLLGRRTAGASEGMSWASSGMGAGTTIGAFSGGWLADRTGSGAAFWLCVVFGAAALTIAWRATSGGDAGTAAQPSA
ncbi:MFS transporter [Microbispora bryophytorum]|uniref:MFS transporter n=1 Tax=Microbispora bryophytorum TaxID=1460882 RepID=UPI003409AFA5